MPNSQLITAPDIIESVLVINATKPQLDSIVNAVASSEKSFNIYCYQSDSKQFEWLDTVFRSVQTILMSSENPEITAGNGTVIRFGPDQKLREPAQYFNK